MQEKLNKKLKAQQSCLQKEIMACSMIGSGGVFKVSELLCLQLDRKWYLSIDIIHETYMKMVNFMETKKL